MQPVSIKLLEKRLQIVWNDNSESLIKLANLRRFCPCAACASAKGEQSKSYIPIYSDQELAIKNIQPIGNYAIGIIWADDHNTGIYDYAYLKQLAEQLKN
jgi:DUF971 family protein